MSTIIQLHLSKDPSDILAVYAPDFYVRRPGCGTVWIFDRFCPYEGRRFLSKADNYNEAILKALQTV